MNNATEILNILKKNKLEKELFPFLEYFPSPALIIDENFEVVQVNQFALKLIGIKSEQIKGSNAIQLFSGIASSEFKQLFKDTIQNSGYNTMELIIKKGNGSNINCLATLKCFKWGDNDNKYCSLALIDFTTQKMNEEILKQSQLRFKNLANTAPVMIWISDLDGLFSFVNNVWLDFTGSEPGEQLGMNWLRNVHPVDLEKILNGYQKAITTKSEFSFEFRFMRADKNYEWVLLKGKPRYSIENIYTGFIGSCISINEQKEIEAKVSKLNEELVELNNTKDKFFSIISHDLRGPLGGLMGILDILESSYSTIDENEKLEIISEASKSAKTTFNLMENLLEWARIQSGKIKYQPENLRLSSIINNIISIFDQNLRNKKINVKSNIKPDLKIFSDKLITETILRNLVSNAIKFTNINGIIEISAENLDKSVLIKIKDSGVGMNEKRLKNLFRIDVSSSTKGTAKEVGTGLGLIICKEFVEKQGGKIWAESKVNEGSTFHFTVNSSS